MLSDVYFHYHPMHAHAQNHTYNRCSLDETLDRETQCSRRYNRSLSLLVVDFDRFKSDNAQEGSVTGDVVIQSFAAFLRRNSRQSDSIAWCADQRFAVLLSDTPLQGAVACAKRVRQTLVDHPIAPQIGHVTASFGVATLMTGESGADLHRRATCALSRSKKEGRNRVTQAIAQGQIAATDVSSCVNRCSTFEFCC